MTGVFRSEPLSFKDMSQMAPAGRANNFDSSPIWIGMPADRARDGIVETGPPASGVKLVV
ncbi:MAG: hypothetical protein BMS9Abin05_1406 [Rhodothermia bacterium]|nr:MAG: hypothetical protein BMS9Abin05_1406 [Rhodothermia bacterium]